MRQQDSARSAFVTTSSEEASLLIWSQQRFRSEETQFPIAKPAICGAPQKAGELRVQGRAVTTPVEQSACCLETELASVLVSFVTFRQTVSGPYCLRRQLEHHVPVPRKDQDTSLLERSRSMQAALLPHLANESVSSAIHPATAVFGDAARKSAAVPSWVKRLLVRTSVAAASSAEARRCFWSSSRLAAPLRAACIVAMSG